MNDEKWTELLQRAHNAEWDSEFFAHDGPNAQYPGERALCAAIVAAQAKSTSWRQKFPVELSTAEFDTLPRWPSTIRKIDETFGGFFGLTSLIADKGTGKTMLALSSALQAAATEKWNVKFFGAEVDVDEIQSRYVREMMTHPNAIAGADFFEFIHVGRGQGPEQLIMEMLEFDPELPILVVWDSVNTMVKMWGRDYLWALNEMCMWAAFARKISRGALSFLIVSESNKRGRSKGEALEFWSDMALSMKGKPEETAVDFKIEKLRRGEWVSIPVMTRHWATNRFYSFDDLEMMDNARRRGEIVPGPGTEDATDDNIELF